MEKYNEWYLWMLSVIMDCMILKKKVYYDNIICCYMSESSILEDLENDTTNINLKHLIRKVWLAIP